MNFVAGNQTVSALDDLGFAGFHATPLNHTVRRLDACR
jgi:hypothetical protein